MRITLSPLFVLAFAVLSPGLVADEAAAELRLPNIFGSGMVLQQEREAPIWGWADPRATVVIRAPWLSAPVETFADGFGRWRTKLPTPSASGPYWVTIESGDDAVTFSDVLIGEVWLCSGQSNMEWPLRASDNWEAAAAAARHPRLRLFTVLNAVSASPVENVNGSWQRCTPETAPGFSAVGFYFGQDLLEHLDVPIGLIASDWGGTPAEAWTSEAALEGLPTFEEGLARVRMLRERGDEIRREDDQRIRAWETQQQAADAGRGGEWAAPDFDDSGWETMTQPQTWTGRLGRLDGTVWFRRDVDVPATWVGRALTITLGAIDDNEETYFNGEKIGATNGWQTPRAYVIPAELVREGRNVITVRVEDTGGLGGFSGDAADMTLGVAEAPITPRSLAGEWKYAIGYDRASGSNRPQRRTIGPRMPTALNNGMIQPIAPYAIRGAIWYQGESNRTQWKVYRELLPTMIEDWRRTWDQPETHRDFPFGIVQIAPFNYGNDIGQAAALREAQLMTHRRVSNTGLAVTMDIGDPADIHPRNKKDVGGRLARWARGQVYGAELVWSGPLYREMSIDGDRIRLRFDHVGDGFDESRGRLTHFTIAGEDRNFVPARATIDGDTIVVSSPEVPNPRAVRFAWGAADEPNLFNEAGLPASSFRTDDWPLRD